MEDDDLAAIRQRRMQELMGAGGYGQGGGGAESQEAQEEKQRAADDQRQTALGKILTSEARERLSRIALVKPEKARGVENMILKAAQYGQITERVTEDRLISMLGTVNEGSAPRTKITMSRRRALDDD